MADGIPPKSLDELLADIEREWNALMQVVDRLTPEQMTTPDPGGWSPKDNLAHIGEWMNILMEYHINGRPRHEAMKLSPENADLTDYDEINKNLYEHHRDQSPDEVLSELRNIHARLMKKLGGMSFEELLKPRFPDQPERGPLLNWITGNTTDHFAEHRMNIERALGAGKH